MAETKRLICRFHLFDYVFKLFVKELTNGSTRVGTFLFSLTSQPSISTEDSINYSGERRLYSKRRHIEEIAFLKMIKKNGALCILLGFCLQY